MSCLVAIGTQWGDEGKAKMIDFLTKDADIIVRYQGERMQAIPSW